MPPRRQRRYAIIGGAAVFVALSAAFGPSALFVTHQPTSPTRPPDALGSGEDMIGKSPDHQHKEKEASNTAHAAAADGAGDRNAFHVVTSWSDPGDTGWNRPTSHRGVLTLSSTSSVKSARKSFDALSAEEIAAIQKETKIPVALSAYEEQATFNVFHGPGAGSGKRSRNENEPVHHERAGAEACPRVRSYTAGEYNRLSSLIGGIDKSSPGYKMPWFYHDPYPVCGRVLLEHLYRGGRHSFALAISPDSSTHAADDRNNADKADGNANHNLSNDHGPEHAKKVTPVPKLEQLQYDARDSQRGTPPSSSSIRTSFDLGGLSNEHGSGVTSSKKSTGEAKSSSPKPNILRVKAGAVVSQVFVRDCGSCGQEDHADRHNCASDILLTARLVGHAAFVPATVTPLRESQRKIAMRSPHAARKIARTASHLLKNNYGEKKAHVVIDVPVGATHQVSFVAHVPGLYKLEVKVIHVNGTSDNPRLPRTLGVIGIRAVDSGNRKAFKYNNACDEQRHVVGSPIDVLVEPSEGQNPDVTFMGDRRGGGASPHPVSSRSKKDENERKEKEPGKHVATRALPFCTFGSATDVLKNEPYGSSWLVESSDGHSVGRRGRGSGGGFTGGFWVRHHSWQACATKSGNPYCYGDPKWLTDAAGYNTEYLYVPRGCRMHFYSPPRGPPGACMLAQPPRTSFLLFVGDSVSREYAKACGHIGLAAAKLKCLFANIALEGKHYSTDYAKAVVKAIIENVNQKGTGVLVTNLGIHHMIGPCTTKQWAEFVHIFADAWRRDVRWAVKNSASRPADRRHHSLLIDESLSSPRKGMVGNNGQNGASTSKAAVEGELTASYRETVGIKTPVQKEGESADTHDIKTSEKSQIEIAIWQGPPTIHYARLGMGAQRAALWDQIAWEALRPLGFRRLDAQELTETRQEATWDGLHYASYRGKVHTRHRNKDVPIYPWSGGVANALVTLVVNMVCNRNGTANSAMLPW